MAPLTPSVCSCCSFSVSAQIRCIDLVDLGSKRTRSNGSDIVPKQFGLLFSRAVFLHSGRHFFLKRISIELIPIPVLEFTNLCRRALKSLHFFDTNLPMEGAKKHSVILVSEHSVLFRLKEFFLHFLKTSFAFLLSRSAT